MVSIRDSASRDPSSNLGRTQIFFTLRFSFFFSIHNYYFLSSPMRATVFRHIFII